MQKTSLIVRCSLEFEKGDMKLHKSVVTFLACHDSGLQTDCKNFSSKQSSAANCLLIETPMKELNPVFMEKSESQPLTKPKLKFI